MSTRALIAFVIIGVLVLLILSWYAAIFLPPATYAPLMQIIGGTP